MDNKGLKFTDLSKDTTLLFSTLLNSFTDYRLQDKTILVIGAPPERKKYIWDVARENAVKIVLVDNTETTLLKGYASCSIQYDCRDSSKDNIHAEKIIEIVHSKGIIVDGCVTFTECYSPLAALICSKLNLNGAGREGAKIAKSKYLTQKVLREGNLESRLSTRTHTYTSKTVRINSEDEINSAILEVGLPAVLKFEYGSGSFFVKKVFDFQECINEYRKFQIKYLSDEKKQKPRLGFGHGSTLVLVEFVEGTEHDINLVVLKGKLIGIFIQDRGATRDRNFRDTTATMPTCLNTDQEAQTVQAAYECCSSIRLVTGVFNVTMKMTKSGPKLLEINARMTGFTGRDWTLKCYGIDLVVCAFMTCCGLKPFIRSNIQIRGQIMGVTCHPLIHKEPLSNPEIIKSLRDLRERGIIIYNQIGSTLECDDDDDIDVHPFCSIAVMEYDIGTAKAKLLKICNDLNLNSPNYPIEEFLADFTDKTHE